MTTVAHLTTVHRRHDTRVFLKQCRSLVRAGHAVVLVVADGDGDAEIDGVRIHDLGRAPGLRGRLMTSTLRMAQAARALGAELYHLHDPELLPLGRWLRFRGATVVFDAHEDLPAQLLTKPYLGPRRLRALAAVASTVERLVVARLSAVVAATPAIGRKFSEINDTTVVVNNYPLLDELVDVAAASERNTVCYVGGISEIRGIRELVTAMEHVTSDVELVVAGTFADADLEAEITAMPGWQRVRHLGFQDRDGVRSVLASAFAGVVAFHPAPNHLEAQPNKMFEYMSAGVAVIASDFPVWRQIVESSGSGVCVDPLDPQALADAIDSLARDPAQAAALGAAGRSLVTASHNWSVEEQRLLTLYDSLLVGN